MHKIIAAALLSLTIAGPAFAFGPRTVEFDPAAELRRATGSAQFPESTGGHLQDARTSQGGSQAFPQTTRGIEHSGVAVMQGGSSRFPVLSEDMLNHPPTALSQDQVLTHEFDGEGPVRSSYNGEFTNDIDG